MFRPQVHTLLTRYITTPLARLFLVLHITPNTITLLGLLISLGAAYLLATGHFLAGGALLLMSGVFDMVDGTLARMSGRVTAFGGFLDSVVDRLSEAALLFGLLWHFTSAEDQVGTILVYLALVGSVMVSYMRARGEGLSINSAVGLAQRPERLLILAIGTMLGYVTVTLGVIAALSFLTAGQRLVHIWRHTRAR